MEDFTKFDGVIAKVFSTDEGQQFLRYMEAMYDGNSFNADPYRTAYLCGRRSVYMEIKNNLERIKGVK